jgi:hypothetical protein
LNYLEWLAGGSALAMIFISLASHGKTIFAALKESRRRKQLVEFDRLISGVDSDLPRAEAILRGKSVVAEEISIFLPGLNPEDDLTLKFVSAIRESLDAGRLGDVTRSISYAGNSSCIDIYLPDFVAGLNAVRRVLPEFELPLNASIEYTGGDLPLFDG